MSESAGSRDVPNRAESTFFLAFLLFAGLSLLVWLSVGQARRNHDATWRPPGAFDEGSPVSTDTQTDVVNTNFTLKDAGS